MHLSLHLTPLTDTAMMITMEGELDAATAPVLEAMLRPLIVAEVTHVVAAAGRLRFCDVTGVRQLSAVNKSLHGKGGRLVVAEADSALHRLITLANGWSVPRLHVYTSLAEALIAAGLDPDEVPLQTVIGPRHAPSLRRLTSVRSLVHSARRPRPARRTTPVPPPPPAPPVPSAPPSQAAVSGRVSLKEVLVRSRHLRGQAAYHMRLMEKRLQQIWEAQSIMDQAREQCRSSLDDLRNGRTGG
ncbi:STAS domain-containing protein [Planobispora siamensis]|uniref:STAS domain-containing protein n=1 Tax=Planobispora siamensis TaxID=936338 RepID=A0A8J3SPG3_9ACTN|nr:STAS domain-containing protein [Planobispora siamensis]GIH96989.1 hypothetical protein Psi01_76190 [Planobispora siamensis]